MSVNLYASLAAQHQLDATQAQEISQLAALTSMLSGITDSTPSYNDLTSAAWSMLNKNADTGANVCAATAMSTNIPFDSPLDQSLGSPASTRDFQQSPLQDYEFDFGNIDTPLFPDHGTQQTQNDNLLSGLPLFGTELSFSQSTLSNRNPMLVMSQLQQSDIATAESTDTTIDDFSFDAITRHMPDYRNLTQASLKEIALATSPDVHAIHPAANVNENQSAINAMAADFVRQYARTRSVRDIDALLRSLREAGIDVSDDTVAEILATASFAQSRSPSPASSQASASPISDSFSARSSAMLSSPSPSVSPVTTSTTDSVRGANKTRSSIQLGPKGNLTAHLSRQDKRFSCDVCHKHFDRLFNLRTHALTHVDPNDRDKPYMCPWSECSKPFIRKYDAERHYRSVHVKRGEVATAEQVEMALSGDHGIPAPTALSHADVNPANG